MCVLGNPSNSGKEYGPDDIIRGFAVLHEFLGRDENIQVNGFVYIMDLGGFSMAHVAFMGPETFTKATSCWMVGLRRKLKMCCVVRFRYNRVTECLGIVVELDNF